MYIVTRVREKHLVTARSSILMSGSDSARAYAQGRTAETGEEHFVYQVMLDLNWSYEAGGVVETEHL